MTLQEYRQKVEEILQDLLITHTLEDELSAGIAELSEQQAVDELVSLYEETPGFPATGKNKAIPGNGGVSKPTQEKPESMQSVGGVTNKVTKKHNRPVEPDSPEGLIEEILRACFDSEYNGFNFARAERELSTLIKNLAYLSITRKKKAFRERFTEEGSFKVYGTPAEVFDFFLEDYDEKVQ